MAIESSVTFEENNDVQSPQTPSTPTQRGRWATQHMKGKRGSRKRMSILNRLNHRPSHSSEKSRHSSGSGTDLGFIQEEPNIEAGPEAEVNDRDNQGPRTIYFNTPLPPSAVDENGHPLQRYRRNKIRTAKYTPLSFIPKNLWYQFHNIANIYFFILIILSVSRASTRDDIAYQLRRFSRSLDRRIQDCRQCP
jgi:phospholipid-translocating ATPase